MDDIKRLSALAVALSMLVANMTAVAVSADETDAETEQEITEIVSETIEETESYEEPADTEGAVTEENITENIVTEVYENQDSVEQVSEPVNEVSGETEQFTEDTQIQADDIFTGESEASAVNKGKGELEGLVQTKVFQVTLPVEGNSLDYIADPQGLINETEAAKHPDSLYDAGTNVYFNNGEIIAEDGRQVTHYSAISNPLTIVNKSSCAVSVVARVSAYYEQGADSPVALASDREWDNVKKPSIFLSVIKSDDQSEIVLSQREKVITASVPGCPGAYKYVYETGLNGEEEYKYRLMSDDELAAFRADSANAGIDTSFKDFSLCMTGECNRDGEWDPNTEYDFPSTSIVWNVGFAVSAKPCINTVEYSVAYGSSVDIPYSLGAFDSAASGIVSAEYISPDGEVMQVAGNEAYIKTTEDIITLTSDLAYYAHTKDGGLIRFRFNDPEETVIDVNLDNNAAPSLDEKECSVSKSDSSLSIAYDLGVGNKAASGITGITFGSTDFSSSAYSSVTNGKIVLNAGAVRTIQMKNGGKVYVTFDDQNHTRCSIKVTVE